MTCYSFTLPYYLYLMVTISLLFSALKFYQEIRCLFFSYVDFKENCLTQCKETKCRFFVI